MNATPDMITAGLKMIASLGVVLALILALLYGLRRLTGQRPGRGGGNRIQILESHYVGVKKTISLVRVPGKVLVLGITGDRISLLDTLDGDSIESTPPEVAPLSFGPLLADRLKKFGQSRKGRADR